MRLIILSIMLSIMVLPFVAAPRMDNLNLVEDSAIYIQDTVPPSISIIGNFSVSGGNITTATNVNISANVSDLYWKNVNISTNSSSVWVNTSIVSEPNTTFSLIIQSSSFSVGKIVGWTVYAKDNASNTIQSSIFTFEVQAVPIPPQTGSGSGGASIYTSGAEAGTTVFASQRSSNLCLEGFGYFEGKCYSCSGTLSKNAQGNVVCTVCKAGFESKDGKCSPMALKLPYQSKVNLWIDSTSEKISPETPLLGFLIIVASTGLIGTFIYNDFQRRRVNGQR